MKCEHDIEAFNCLVANCHSLPVREALQIANLELDCGGAIDGHCRNFDKVGLRKCRECILLAVPSPASTPRPDAAKERKPCPFMPVGNCAIVIALEPEKGVAEPWNAVVVAVGADVPAGIFVDGIVVLTPHSGYPLEADGETYTVVHAGEILAIVRA